MCHGRTRVAACGATLIAAFLVHLISFARANAGEPEYPASRLGVRTAPLLLLSRPDVRAELALSPEQVASAERTMSDLYVRGAALKGKRGPEIVAARLAIDEAQQRWIDTQLTDDQRTRLIQIDLQWEGPAALTTRPTLAESLALTPVQRHAIVQAVAERDSKKSQGQYQPADERKLAEATLAVLSAQQKALWRAMLGKPFVPQLAASPSQKTR
jgi:hypothetical protein